MDEKKLHLHVFNKWNLHQNYGWMFNFIMKFV